MIMLEKFPTDLSKKKDSWKAKRSTWLKKAKKEEEMYLNDVEGTGTAFTEEQLEKVGKETGVPVNINYIHPLVNQKLAILASTKPSFRVVGLDDRGKKWANVYDKAVKSIMYNSEASGEEEETIKSMLISGMGISMINEKDFYQFGSFNIQYEDVHPSIIILDADSKKRSMQDSRGFFIEKEIPFEEAELLYGDIVEEINLMKIDNGEEPITMEYFYGMDSSPEGRGRVETAFDEKEPITVTEYYDQKLTEMYFIKDPKGNIQRVFKENLSKDADFILSDPIDIEKDRFVRKTLFLGEYKVNVEMKPSRNLPIKVKFFEWGGSPYNSYGVIHFILAMQEALDKSVQLMLKNGMLTNNAGYLSPKGGIPVEDKPKWESQGNTPGVVKEYVPQIINGQLMVPEREQIQGLSNYFPSIIQLMTEMMKTSTGINAVTTGDAQEAGIDAFSTLKQYQDASNQRIKLAMSHINLANQQLGNVVLDFLVANINLNSKYAFFDEKGKINEIDVVKENLEALSQGRYMVLSVASEAMPTEKLAMANSLMQISQTTPDPHEKNIYIKEAFRLSDLRGFDEIQEEVDTVKKLQSTISQLEDRLQRDEELMKQYENRALNAEYKAKLAQSLSDLETKVESLKVKAEADMEIETLEEKIKMMKKTLNDKEKDNLND